MIVEKAKFNHENKMVRYQVTYDFTTRYTTYTVVKWKTTDVQKRGYAGHDTIARSIESIGGIP